jgi:hypothetical protein
MSADPEPGANPYKFTIADIDPVMYPVGGLQGSSGSGEGDVQKKKKVYETEKVVAEAGAEDDEGADEGALPGSDSLSLSAATNQYILHQVMTRKARRTARRSLI